MAICHICQEPNRDRNIFCVNCGAEIIPNEPSEPSAGRRRLAPQADPVQEKAIAPFPDLPEQPEQKKNLSSPFPEEPSASLKNMPPCPDDPPGPKDEEEHPPNLDLIANESTDEVTAPDEVSSDSRPMVSRRTSPALVGWENECTMCGFHNEPDAVYCCQCGTAFKRPETSTADFDNRAKLIQIAEDGSQADEHDINADGLAIDSKSGGVFPMEMYRAQRHALFRMRKGEIVLIPPSGKNHILTRIPSKIPRKIQTGGTVSIGGQMMLFEASTQKPGVWGLLTTQHDSEAKKIIELDQEDITIGRESGQVRFEDDPLISRSHMRIYIANGRYFVMDLESTNGTFVGVDTHYTALPGEVFLIGGVIYKIAYA